MINRGENRTVNLKKCIKQKKNMTVNLKTPNKSSFVEVVLIDWGIGENTNGLFLMLMVHCCPVVLIE